MYSKFVYLDRLCHSFSSVWMKNYPVSLLFLNILTLHSSFLMFAKKTEMFFFCLFFLSQFLIPVTSVVVFAHTFLFQGISSIMMNEKLLMFKSVNCF